MESHCKNCNTVCDTSFCGVCGQKMHIHRFDTKHIFLHEIPHGVVHLDKGFLLTTKALLTRPGHFIREYIEGKRVNHYGPIQYVFIIGIILGLLMGFMNFEAVMVKISESMNKEQAQSIVVNPTQKLPNTDQKKKLNVAEVQKKIAKNITQQYKWFIFLMIPAAALAGFLVTRKLGYNFAENIVRSLYNAGLNGIASIAIMPMLLFNNLVISHSVLGFLSNFILTSITWLQFLKPKKPELADRFISLILYWILFSVFTIVSMLILGAIIAVYIFKSMKNA